MGDKVKCAPPNLRMDDLLGTVSDYGAELAVMNQRIEETCARKTELQRTLEMKRERTAALRAEVHALRVKEGELEEQEKVQLNRIEKSNSVLKDSNAKLDKTRERETELRKQIVQKVSEFEADSRSIALRFQSLQLVDEDERCGSNVNIVTEADVSELQKEVARLEAEVTTFSTSRSGLPHDELKDLVREVKVKLQNLKKLNQDLVEEEASLRNMLHQLQEGSSS
ncbi:uncharacterized protein [Panulirus ornatus]|uniref:uncharacterized protein isoform X1 n=1 Tax=Panulirus ornatus TaxID=150431 RepID=UPI003A87F567